jgi:polyribonucleotide nucleotidyltransferase
MEETGTQIDFNEDNSGRGYISCVGPIEGAEKAKAIIMSIAREPEVGDMFITEVARIISKTGAFCDIAPGKSGMIHISKICKKHINTVEEVLNIGDKVKVEIIKISEKGIDLKLLEKIEG